MAFVAVLKHLGSGTEHVLVSRHVVGRSATCQLRLSEPQVSGLHAELSWEGHCWIVQDLGSRNGTFVDGTRLQPGERAPVQPGARLAFGNADEGYGLVDAEPPCLMAVATDGRTVVTPGNLMSLPSSESPELTVFEDADGQWVLEADDGRRTLDDCETVIVDGVSWTIHLPTASDRTHDAESRPPTLDAIGLELRVSRSRDHVSMRLTHDHGRQVELEYRAHAHLLVLLASARRRDHDQGELPEPEQGWVHRDEIARELAIDASLINLWVHRARQQLAKAGVRDAGNVIERRPGTQQLRIGIGHVTVLET